MSTSSAQSTVQDPAVCLVSDRCGPALQHDRFIWADDGQHVTSLVQAAPATFGAAIVFGPPSGGAGAPLNTFELRVNHTAMPSTLATFSDFAIGTVKMTQMPDSDWQAYFWTANLLHAVERCMMARWLHGDNATLPLDIEVNVRALRHTGRIQSLLTCVLIRELRALHSPGRGHPTHPPTRSTRAGVTDTCSSLLQSHCVLCAEAGASFCSRIGEPCRIGTFVVGGSGVR